MKKICFIFGVHCHQPVGNFNTVFEKAFLKAYQPFWEILHRHPRVKVSAHFSGCLLEWLNTNQPEFLLSLQRLARAGQVEMISGGFYEPLLPLLPREDAFGQISMMNRFCKRFSLISPRGLWIAERVWEPHLASLISDAGNSYTVVDDNHFGLVGLKPEELDGYYATEDGGKTLFIFPGSERLRYFVPFKMPEETINYLKERRERGKNCAVLSDDGEKFGIWPDTYEWVYKKGWLERFFTVLEENSDWIEFTTFSEYMDRFPPSGRVYLPCASYREMLEWSGGFFRNFFVRYPEANHMHKRMLRVSRILQEAGKKGTSKKLLNNAKRELYKAQCNCAYWHGIFGGLYLHHLRQAVYEHLLKAEGIKKRKAIDVASEDMDCDGHTEIILTTPHLALYIDPQEGGMLTEIDYLPMSVNITNTLTRRREAYHERLVQSASQSQVASIHDQHRVKEEGLDKYISYDPYRKASLIDHFLSEEAVLSDFIRGGLNLTVVPYKPSLMKKKDKFTLILSRDGVVNTLEGEMALALDKVIQVDRDSSEINILYRIKNSSSGCQQTGKRQFRLRLGIEFNFSVYSHQISEPGERPENAEWILDDDWFGMRIQFSFSQPVTLWHFPIMTVSGSEGGLEKTYQGVSLLFHRYLTDKQDSLKLKVQFSGRR